VRVVEDRAGDAVILFDRLRSRRLEGEYNDVLRLPVFGEAAFGVLCVSSLSASSRRDELDVGDAEVTLLDCASMFSTRSRTYDPLADVEEEADVERGCGACVLLGGVFASIW
jgi:hypothetical protein